MRNRAGTHYPWFLVSAISWIVVALAGALVVLGMTADDTANMPLSPFDFDDDGDIDLRDFAVFQNTFDLDDFAVFLYGFTGPLDGEGKD